MVGRTMTSSDHRLWFPPSALPSAFARANPFGCNRKGRAIRGTVRRVSAALDRDADELSAQLVVALAGLAQAMGRDLAEADWWRLLDALLLIAAHPA
jgi:hypothetical protein